MWKQICKQPAWVDLNKLPSPDPHPAKPEEVQALATFFKGDITVQRIYLDGRFLNQYIVNADRRECFLVRWCPHVDYFRNLHLHKLASWLCLQGVDTPRPVCSPIVVDQVAGAWDVGLLLVTPFFKHRSLYPDVVDMSKLGMSLANLHNSLSKHPSVNLWKRKTSERIAHLSTIRFQLGTGKLIAGPRSELLRDIAKDPLLEFDKKSLKPTCLHGDMNLGNTFVVVTDGQGQKAGQVMLIDFEDVDHSVLPVCFEFALIIERFIIVQSSSEDEIIKSIKALFDSYKKHIDPANQIIDQNIDWLVTIKSLNLRSLCVLASIEKSGGYINKMEWEKFFHLIELATLKKEIWDRVSF